MSRESARNVDTRIAKKDAMEVIRHSRRLGIRPATYLALGRQLLVERRRPPMSNRRRTYQSVLQFDIFARQLRRSRPRFSTFFTNHVASAMHRYWAAHRPGDYPQLGLGQDWVELYRDEVMWATAQAADMAERLAGHVDATPGAQLWIASSMGPAMLPQFNLVVETEYVEAFREALETVRVGGQPSPSRHPTMASSHLTSARRTCTTSRTR